MIGNSMDHDLVLWTSKSLSPNGPLTSSLSSNRGNNGEPNVQVCETILEKVFLDIGYKTYQSLTSLSLVESPLWEQAPTPYVCSTPLAVHDRHTPRIKPQLSGLEAKCSWGHHVD